MEKVTGEVDEQFWHKGAHGAVAKATGRNNPWVPHLSTLWASLGVSLKIQQFWKEFEQWYHS
jgi:hypothetical protein